MKSPYIWIIIALIAIIAALILFDKDPPATDTTAFKHKIEQDRQVIKGLQSELTETLARIKHDSLQQVSEAEAYRKDTDSLQRRINDLKGKPRVVYIRQTELSIDSLITAQDSLIVTQSARIDTLTVNIADLRINLTQVRLNFEGQINALESISSNQSEIIAVQEKELKRERRQKRLVIIGGVVATVAALVLR